MANDRSGWLGRSHDERDRHRGWLCHGARARTSPPMRTCCRPPSTTSNQTSSRTIRATEGQHGMAALRSCCLEILPLDATSRDEAVWSSRSGSKLSPTPASPNATNGPRVSGEQRSSTSSPRPAKQARSIPTCATSRSSVTFSPLSSGRRSPRRSCRVLRQHRRRSPNSTAISTHSTPHSELERGYGPSMLRIFAVG